LIISRFGYAKRHSYYDLTLPPSFNNERLSYKLRVPLPEYTALAALFLFCRSAFFRTSSNTVEISARQSKKAQLYLLIYSKLAALSSRKMSVWDDLS